MLFVGVFCGNGYLQVLCMCVVLYIVFSYAVLSFMHVTYYKLMHVNQHNVPVLLSVFL